MIIYLTTLKVRKLYNSTSTRAKRFIIRAVACSLILLYYSFVYRCYSNFMSEWAERLELFFLRQSPIATIMVVAASVEDFV